VPKKEKGEEDADFDAHRIPATPFQHLLHFHALTLKVNPAFVAKVGRFKISVLGNTPTHRCRSLLFPTTDSKGKIRLLLMLIWNLRNVDSNGEKL